MTTFSSILDGMTAASELSLVMPDDSIRSLYEDQERNIFHIIRDIGPILLQHPYESFGTSVRKDYGNPATSLYRIRFTLARRFRALRDLAPVLK